MLDWFANTWNELKTFLYSLVLTVQDIMKDIGIFFFESFMDISLLAIDGLDSFFAGLDVASHINGLPSGVTYYASALGLSQAMGMIIIAITIRMLLQLIPFVRLGS
ncbi:MULTISPECIES: DUF2523 family protein [unclassified Pseudoalteromonas]|uniref:DUF2523 family protein n=1 Tax=unclassified Pseudoalteromonas TaxID=194690 RepID=UPI0005195801|nr:MULTISPECIES: DUF2523 family protein [unclassified Pseudoalteromonas]